jgi:hypothetical protein
MAARLRANSRRDCPLCREKGADSDLQGPGRSVFIVEQFIGIFTVGDSFVDRIPLNAHIHGQRYVSQKGKTGGPVAVFQVT